MKTYCNLDLLKDQAGFTLQEISILPRISSWAISAYSSN
jgi:hypothetical protein